MADSSRPLLYSRSLEHACHEIQVAWPLICRDYVEMFPDRHLRITTTYRSQVVQEALWLQGRMDLRTVNEVRVKIGLAPIKAEENRKITWTKSSKHTRLPSLALDFVVMTDPDGVDGPLKPALDWSDEKYTPMMLLAPRYGLRSGGAFGDLPHVEVA